MRTLLLGQCSSASSSASSTFLSKTDWLNRWRFLEGAAVALDEFRYEAGDGHAFDPKVVFRRPIFSFCVQVCWRDCRPPLSQDTRVGTCTSTALKSAMGEKRKKTHTQRCDCAALRAECSASLTKQSVFPRKPPIKPKSYKRQRGSASMSFCHVFFGRQVVGPVVPEAKEHVRLHGYK